MGKKMSSIREKRQCIHILHPSYEGKQKRNRHFARSMSHLEHQLCKLLIAKKRWLPILFDLARLGLRGNFCMWTQTLPLNKLTWDTHCNYTVPKSQQTPIAGGSHGIYIFQVLILAVLCIYAFNRLVYLKWLNWLPGKQNHDLSGTYIKLSIYSKYNA